MRSGLLTGRRPIHWRQRKKERKVEQTKDERSKTGWKKSPFKTGLVLFRTLIDAHTSAPSTSMHMNERQEEVECRGIKRQHQNPFYTSVASFIFWDLCVAMTQTVLFKTFTLLAEGKKRLSSFLTTSSVHVRPYHCLSLFKKLRGMISLNKKITLSNISPESCSPTKDE